jgi:hypothetical protein
LQERDQPLTLARLRSIAEIMAARVRQYEDCPALAETYTYCLEMTQAAIRRRLAEAPPDPS